MKDNLVLAKLSQHVSIYLKQFPSYSNRNCQKKSPFSRTAAHIFVSPGDAPAIITQYVARMERQFNACQIPRSMYLSIFNSSRVIRCLTQCVRPKIAIFTTFLFPLETPLWLSSTQYAVWIEREFDAYKLSRWMYPSNYNRFSDRARYWSGRRQGKQKCGLLYVKIAIFWLTHWLKHRITRKLLKIDGYMLQGGLASTELSFNSCNVLRDCHRGVPRANKKMKAGVRKNGDFYQAMLCMRYMPSCDVRPSV